jgi:hypothetical protein
MTTIDARDARYMIMIADLAAEGIKIENDLCPECGGIMPPATPISHDDDEQLFLDMHTILVMHHAHADHESHENDQYALVIGCEGYWIFDPITGKIKDLDSLTDLDYWSSPLLIIPCACGGMIMCRRSWA